MTDDLETRPLDAGRWPDLERLFGARGACGGCWCMWWRIKRSEFETRKGESNRRALRELVEGGVKLGLLAYREGEPIGWCAVEPRDRYPVLGRSRTLKPVDDEPVWSVTCFFVRRGDRGRQVTERLLEAAIDYVAAAGGKIVEGYPVEPRSERMPDAFAWTGFASTFRKLGFREVARRSATRPIFRLEVAR